MSKTAKSSKKNDSVFLVQPSEFPLFDNLGQATKKKLDFIARILAL